MATKPSLAKILESNGYSKDEAKGIAEALRNIGNSKMDILSIPIKLRVRDVGKAQEAYVQYLAALEEYQTAPKSKPKKVDEEDLGEGGNE